MKKKIAALAVICAMIICAAGCSSAPAGAAAEAEAVSKITVSASGSVSLVPDKATVSFGVQTKEDTAEEAQSRNSESVQKVMDALKGIGVEEKSIRTTYYGMYPQYDYSEDGDQNIIGYVVTTSLSVQDQNIDGLGELLQTCVDAGINSVDNISFLCSGYDEAYKEALAKAVAASRDKAEALAAAAGKKLGETYSITEGWQDTSARYGKNVAEAAAMDISEADRSSPILQPGETEITANVTVEYKMQ